MPENKNKPFIDILINDLDLSDCTDEEKEMYKNDIEEYLHHRKRRIALRKEK